MEETFEVECPEQARVAALERGIAALTERVERLEAEVLPKPAGDWGLDEPELP